MSLVPGQSSRRVQIIAKKYCSKCGLYKDHMLLRKWTEKGSDSDSYVKAEAWMCSYCDTTQENRSQEGRPTEEILIIRRLLKLSGDYEQVRHSTLEVRGDTLVFKVKLFPWAVVRAARRVEEAKGHGFFRLGDLWRLQQHNLLKGEEEGDSCKIAIRSRSRTRSSESRPSSREVVDSAA